MAGQKEWYSAERAAFRRFQGCSKRSKDRMPDLFVLCINTVVKHCDEERITCLPLPTSIKEQILSELILPERQLTDDVVGEHIVWIFPTDETLHLRPKGCYFYTEGESGEMESRVRVKILREMCLNGGGIEREPSGWFHFQEASQFDTLPEIFIRFVQQHLGKTECCKHSSSQIIIIFKEEEEEHRDIDPKISDLMKNVCSMEPKEGGIEKHLFPQTMERAQEADGSLFLLR